MNAENTPAFQAGRVFLRRFSEADQPAVFRNLTGEDRCFSNDPLQTEQESLVFLRNLFCRYEEQAPCHVWCISLNGEAIGFSALSLYPEVPIARLSFLVGRAFRGQGFASEAVSSVLGYAFCVLALHRVEAECVKENRASARVLEKCGMCCEGLLREKYYVRNSYYDSLLYAILYRDYHLK